MGENFDEEGTFCSFASTDKVKAFMRAVAHRCVFSKTFIQLPVRIFCFNAQDFTTF